MKKRLIFIHGRAQEGRRQPDILEEWRKAWVLGLTNAGLALSDVVDIALPFYGDALDDLVRKAGTPTPDARARGGVTDEEMAFKSALFKEIADDKGIAVAEIDRHDETNVRERGMLNWGWVQAMLRSIDDRTGIGQNALDRFTHDVFVYLKWPAVRAAVDSLVTAELTSEPCVVVAHSLGSVVGFNVLRAQAHQLNVALYATLGSPLGIRAIQDCLDLPLEMPRCVHDWFNARDERDVVALRTLDDSAFPIRPRIRNHTSVRNKTDNRHGISGYLDDRLVASEIFSAL